MARDLLARHQNDIAAGRKEPLVSPEELAQETLGAIACDGIANASAGDDPQPPAQGGAGWITELRPLHQKGPALTALTFCPYVLKLRRALQALAGSQAQARR